MSKPYFEKKNVILCRSGIQFYKHNELPGLQLDSPPKVIKDVYAVYRPPEVIRAAAEMCKMLPITKEHPPVFVDGDNWNQYAEGYTGENVRVVDLEDGEIGLESSLVFSTRKIYSYYKNNNKMVSLGYQCRNKWVEGKDWDIELVSIDSVNHLAITAMGRGGESVSVLDSMKAVFDSVRSGIFHYAYACQGVTDSEQDFVEKFMDYVEDRNMDGIRESMYAVCLMKDSPERKELFDSMTEYIENPNDPEAIANRLKMLYNEVETQTIKVFNV
jgi:hypothetical protein